MREKDGDLIGHETGELLGELFDKGSNAADASLVPGGILLPLVFCWIDGGDFTKDSGSLNMCIEI